MTQWRHGHPGKTGIALAISFFLILQSFLAPITQAQAANASALDAALAVICSTTQSHEGGSGDQHKPAHCELPCCLPAQRAALQIDAPLVESITVYVAPLLQLAYATPFRLWADLLPNDLVSSGQNRARAPPEYS